MDFESLEEIIRPLARRYTSDVVEIDDFEQVGRMTAWQVLEKRPDASLSFIIKAIKNQFASILHYKNAKKRNRGKRPVSLDTNFEEGERGNLLDVVEGESGVLSTEEVMGDFIRGLRRRLGKQYIRGVIRSGRGVRGGYREKVREIVRAVIEGTHKIPEEEIPKKVNYKFFVDNGLQHFLWVFYKNSPFNAVMDAYEGRLIPWKFKRKPMRFWRGRGGYERALMAVKWFCDKKEIKNIEGCRYVGTDDFIEEELGGMLQAHFNHSPYLALKTQFPSLSPWQTAGTSARFFNNKDNQLEALSSYLMDNGCPSIIKLSPEEVYELGLRTFVTQDSLCEAGLRGLLRQYSSNIYSMFCSLFPGKILPWTLHSIKGAWRDDPEKTGAEAVRWLFDDYLKIPTSEIPMYATCDLFWRVGFSGILTNRNIGYNSSPYAAVDSAYPGRFSRAEFKRSRWDPLPKIDIPNHKKSQRKVKSQ